jgi:hypothetical protein
LNGFYREGHGDGDWVSNLDLARLSDISSK